MAGDAAWEGELGEQALHTLFVGRNVRIDLAIGPLQVGVRDQTGTAMTGAGNVDYVEIVLVDHPIEVSVDEVQSGRCSPVPEEPGLDVLLGERLLEQRVVVEIDLSH